MNTLIKSAAVAFILIGGGIAIAFAVNEDTQPADMHIADQPMAEQNTGAADLSEPASEQTPSPLAIDSLRNRSYPGGQFAIEQQLSNGTNYERFIASYQSEGLQMYGLLTVPLADPPAGGYPAVVFVHGYIPPDQYSTVESYPTYQATLARAGFVTFKPDLRGHGRSEGDPVSAHHSEKYVVDTMHAISYLQDYERVNPQRIGYWGHSNGGEIGLRVAVISNDIQAASFWSGVVGSYEDMFETYVDDIPFLRANENPLIRRHGLPSENPQFWNTIDPYAHLDDITIPIQLQHGTADASVPVELSRQLRDALEREGVTVEYYEYPGDDHNIAQNSGTAWQRSIQFFRDHL